MNSHKTKTVRLPVQVDCNIVKTVLWLNRIGARTDYSCEGGLTLDVGVTKPYVSFTCSQKVLLRIMKEIQGFADVEVNGHLDYVRYVIRFRSTVARDLFQSRRLR